MKNKRILKNIFSASLEKLFFKFLAFCFEPFLLSDSKTILISALSDKIMYFLKWNMAKCLTK